MAHAHVMGAPGCFYLGGDPHATQQSSSYSLNIMGHTALGAQQSHPIPLASLHFREGSSLPDLNPVPQSTQNPVADVKPGDSSAVIRY